MPKTAEHNAKNSAAMLGKNKGKTYSTKGKPKEKYLCSECGGLIGGKSNLIRWHGNNCEKKKHDN